MPNGSDKNWIRFCSTVDAFRTIHGQWPTKMRIAKICFADLVGHVLTPIGYASVSSKIELIMEHEPTEITFRAEDDSGGFLDYGDDDFDRNRNPEPSTHQFFGCGVVREGVF